MIANLHTRGHILTCFLIMSLAIPSLVFPSDIQFFGGHDFTDLSDRRWREDGAWDKGGNEPLVLPEMYHHPDETSSSQIVFFEHEADFRKRMNSGPYGQVYPNLLALELIEPDESSISKTDLTSATTTLSMQLFDTAISLHQGDTSRSLDQIMDPTITGQLSILGLTPLIEAGLTGTGVRIGIIDAGVDFSHPALQHLEFEQQDFNNDSSIGNRIHGTEVVSAIAGVYPTDDGPLLLGPAPDAFIVSAAMGSPSLFEIEGDFLAAFDYLIQHNPDVINTSFGGSTYLWEPIVERLSTLGIILVGSVGNAGDDELSPFIAEGPGSVASAIGVGGVNPDGSFWELSSSGPTRQGYVKPDVVAPSSQVLLANPFSDSLFASAGTSFASPLVAGGVALILQSLEATKIDLTSSQIKGLMMDGSGISANLSQSINSSGIEFQIGHGLPNFDTILSLINNSSQPSLVISPTSSPMFYFTNHLRGSTQSLNLYAISSVSLSTLVVEITGNITSYIDVGSEYPLYEGTLPITISTNSSAPYGYYDGTLSFSLDNISQPVVIQVGVLVQQDVRGSVLQHLRFTDRQFANELGYFGTRTMQAIKFLRNKGYEVSVSSDLLSLEYLIDFDVLWLPDFLTNSYLSSASIDIHGYNQTIRDLLVSYVNDGGNLFIDMVGRFDENDETELGLPVAATDINVMNQFLSAFNIRAREALIGSYLSSSQDFTFLNSTDLNSYGTQIQYTGNYLEIAEYNNPRTIPIVRAESHIYFPGLEVAKEGYGLIFYHGDNNGRLAISSSTRWFDNCVFDATLCSTGSRSYSLYSTILFENIFHFFNTTSDLSFIEFNQYQDVFTGTLLVASNESLSIRRSSYLTPLQVVEIPFQVVDGDSRSFEFDDINSDGIFILEVTQGDNFHKFQFKADVTAPSIADLNLGGELSKDDLLTFEIRDMSDIQLEIILDLSLEISDYELSVQYPAGSDLVGIYSLRIPLTNIDFGGHQLDINVLDETDHRSSLQLSFRMRGEKTLVSSFTTTLPTTTSASDVLPIATTSSTSYQEIRTRQTSFPLGSVVIGLMVIIYNRFRLASYKRCI